MDTIIDADDDNQPQDTSYEHFLSLIGRKENTNTPGRRDGDDRPPPQSRSSDKLDDHDLTSNNKIDDAPSQNEENGRLERDESRGKRKRETPRMQQLKALQLQLTQVIRNEAGTVDVQEERSSSTTSEVNVLLPPLSFNTISAADHLRGHNISNNGSNILPQQPAEPRSLSNQLMSSFGFNKSNKNNKYLPTYSFLEKDDHDDKSSLPKTSWWHYVFVFSCISFIACVVTLWAPYPKGARMTSEQVAEIGLSDGCQDGLETCICPRATICADNVTSMVLLTISRCLAWFDYPLYMILFFSKCHNLNNYLQNTMLRIFINFSDYHHVHRFFGIWVGVESFLHSLFHIIRWALRNDDIQYLWTSQTGKTGLVTLCCSPLVILPMAAPYLKTKMRFEWRKGLHYLSCVWVLSLMFHAPQRIFWMLGVPFFIYVADMLIGALHKTHLLESAHFERLSESFCLITFENPPGFGKFNAAYVYLVLPWISKVQYHAFTVFPSLNKSNHSSICIHGCGDWTKALMKEVTTPAHKPAYVVGPYTSPFSSPAMDCENLIAVASGIGVTPAISLVKRYSQETLRRVNLIWICRDPGLIEHFITNIASFGQYGFTLIYYTGKGRDIVLNEDLTPNVFLFKGRPNLHQTLSGIIYSIISGDGLPEELCSNQKLISKATPDMRAKLLLEKALSIYSYNQLFQYAVEASSDDLVGGDEKDELIPKPSRSSRRISSTNLRKAVRTTNINLRKSGSFRADIGGSDDDESDLEYADLGGAQTILKQILGGDYMFVEDVVTENFDRFAVKNNKLDSEGFVQLLHSLFDGAIAMDESVQAVKQSLEKLTSTKNAFDTGGRLKKRATLLIGGEACIRQVLQGKGDNKYSTKYWSILYCGGSTPVVNQLKEYEKEFGIGLSIEKFDW